MKYGFVSTFYEMNQTAMNNFVGVAEIFCSMSPVDEIHKMNHVRNVLGNILYIDNELLMLLMLMLTMLVWMYVLIGSIAAIEYVQMHLLFVETFAEQRSNHYFDQDAIYTDTQPSISQLVVKFVYIVHVAIHGGGKKAYRSASLQ